MKLIAAVDKNWNLGNEGKLLFRIPADLKRFQSLTTGNVVVMGRKTLVTLPGGKPLANRENIVLTRDAGLCVPGAVVVNDIASLSTALWDPRFLGKEAYLIGGAQVYAQLLPYCKEALITHIDAVKAADCALMNLAAHAGWELAEQSEPQRHEGLVFRYATYRNLYPKAL